METFDYNKKHWSSGCPRFEKKSEQCSGLEFISLPAALGDDSPESQVAPKNGQYHNAIVVYGANNHIYLYSQEGVPVRISGEGGGTGGEVAFNDITGRPKYDHINMTTSTDIPQVPIISVTDSDPGTGVPLDLNHFIGVSGEGGDVPGGSVAFNDITDRPQYGGVTMTSSTNIPTVPNVSLTTTDPGEGTALAANSFIGVYNA